MLPLASFLLAALLGQPSPTLEDPPPCVAANVPGCLPGYVLKYNRWGWLVYMRDPNYVPPLAQSAPVRLAAVPSQVETLAHPASWASPNTPRAELPRTEAPALRAY